MFIHMEEMTHWYLAGFINLIRLIIFSINCINRNAALNHEQELWLTEFFIPFKFHLSARDKG